MTPFKERIILPDETVILPEHIKAIMWDFVHIEENYQEEWFCRDDEHNRYLLAGARYDYPAPCKDMNGVQIFKRDRVEDEIGGTGTVIQNDEGRWIIKLDTHSNYTPILTNINSWLKVIGHLSYEEDSGDGD